jgi:hypothetical protein
MTTQMLISLGRGRHDSKPTRTACTWTQFAGWMETLPRVQSSLSTAEYAHLSTFPSKSPEGQRLANDKDGPYVVLADLGGHERNYNSLLNSYGVPLDFEAPRVTRDVIEATLVGYAFVAYTSYAYQPNAQRWRVFVPTATPMDRHVHTATWERLNEMFKGAADPAAKDATRLSYLPGKCLLPDQAVIFHADGAFFQPVPVAPDPPATLQTQNGPVPGWAGPTDDAELIKYACNARMRVDERVGHPIHFERLWSANEAWLAKRFPSSTQPWDYTQADMALAGELIYYSGGDVARSISLLRQSGLAQVRNGDDDWHERKAVLAVERAAANAKKYHFMKADVPTGTKADASGEPTPTDDDQRPVIVLKTGAFNRYTEQAEQLLADSVYVHGHGLVRIGRAAEISNDAQLDASGTKREAAQAVCIRVSSGWLPDAHVKAARAAQSRGLSLRGIAADLAAQGLLSRSGKPYGAQSIKLMLTRAA